MAHVTGQEVPPSLLDTYQRALKNGTNITGSYIIASANPTARAAQRAGDQGELAKFAGVAAGWLVNRWLPNADRGSRSSFYRARRAEIVAGNFDAEFWAPAVMFSDTSEHATPWVVAYTGAWNPTYWDNLRKPTKCDYRDIDSSYPTPEGEGTESAPAPGWKGTVINSYWQDLYHVQRRLTFTLQHGITKTDQRPVAIMLDWTIEAAATVRGSKNWFTLIVHPIFHKTNQSPATKKGACVRWARADQYYTAIPSENASGWEFSANHRTARDARRYATFMDSSPCTRLSLRIASPPSLGFYGSRNDDVTVKNYGTATAYTAR